MVSRRKTPSHPPRFTAHYGVFWGILSYYSVTCLYGAAFRITNDPLRWNRFVIPKSCPNARLSKAAGPGGVKTRVAFGS